MAIQRLASHLVIVVALLSGAAPCAAQPSKVADDTTKSVSNPAPANNALADPPRIDPAAVLLQRLTPEKLVSLADMLQQDWPDRPEWAEMALAVMRGQAMQPGKGWWRSAETRYGWTWFKDRYDRNSDNVVERDEFQDGSPRTNVYFDRLDYDLDGRISAKDFDVTALQGASPAATKARLSELLFFRLDTDTNGQVTKSELAEFFDRADRDQSAFLTTEDILVALDGGESRLRPTESRGIPPADLLRLLFAGEMGWFEEGPKLGERAPDFMLATHDNGRTISLSASQGKRPVVLIFGSFT